MEELQRYRSEFFGKLRDVLANRPGIQVVGDRFVFQSEVLFPVGSAELTPAGQDADHRARRSPSRTSPREIPPDVQLGAAGRRPHRPAADQAAAASRPTGSCRPARAITVVKLLIADGVPADHLAATGFGDNQPLDSADTPEAYAKNRRIELRLTDR